MNLYLRLVLCLLFTAVLVSAAILPAPLFRDGVVLQRDKPLPVWGTAEPGERVEVHFRSQTATAVAGADGRWQVTLQAESASAEPAELVMTARNTVVVHDVLVGDVWLCSGQSNMEWKVAASADAEREIAAAIDPLIRHFKVPRTPASTPQTDCGGQWESAAPDTVGEFTAVGYYFAREWRKRTGVPVGLVNSTWGGTQIESWIGDAALRTDPSHEAVAARWQQWLDGHPARVERHQVALQKWRDEQAVAEKEGKPFTRREPAVPEGAGSRREPASLYNGMIHPLQPFALRGVLWYQGEANGERGAEYRTLFPTMIRQWRAEFGQGDLPFGFVQLANFERPVDKSGQQWAFLREAQTAALALPATGMAVTIDIGDPQNIHPKNKQEVGRRLALWAGAHLLGELNAFTGPKFTGMEIEGAQLRLRFSEGQGLRTAGPVPTGFEVAGANRRFVPAMARIEGGTVVLTATGMQAPVAARYAWRNAPEANLCNADGLPAAPFRTDNW
ncbi:MAG: sialate O-acetylesterase [Opitutaceae bacterium]|nr:sialate O-acetylesterase [Opitutaceae bacterium]